MEEESTLKKRERKKLNRLNKVHRENKESFKKKVFTVFAIIALSVGFFWLIFRNTSQEDYSKPQDTKSPVSLKEVKSEDHTKGSTEPIVTLIEYADFQCPACASYNVIVNQLVQEFKDKIQVVYRHFPLSSIHRHAQIAAQAAEAAGDQGYFWEFVDVLYERQNEWSNTRDPRNLFKDYAKELTLNVEQFDKYMNSEEAKKKVRADYESGLAAGIDSTPTFYINGEKVINPKGLEPFRQLVQKIINDSKQEEEMQNNNEPIPQL